MRLDRVLTVHETGIRREGSILDKGRFDRTVKGINLGEMQAKATA